MEEGVPKVKDEKLTSTRWKVDLTDPNWWEDLSSKGGRASSEQKNEFGIYGIFRLRLNMGISRALNPSWSSLCMQAYPVTITVNEWWVARFSKVYASFEKRLAKTPMAQVLKSNYSSQPSRSIPEGMKSWPVSQNFVSNSNVVAEFSARRRTHKAQVF